ncbi:MAG: HEPN domain-containing protein [Clostridiales bacterium]|nr:HEPN domain-containing protein [Clostridiales bacterium]
MEPEFVLEWFRYADIDLLTAQRIAAFHPAPMHIVCFHCQQSAEKNLKGFLIHHGVEEPPKIHDLGRLCKLCIAADARFLEIERVCRILTIYGVQPRYPGEIEITESDMKNALIYAKQIAEFEPLLAARREVEERTEKA